MRTTEIGRSHMAHSSNLDASSVHIANDSFRGVCFSLLFLITVSFCDVLWKSLHNSSFQKAGYFLYPFSFLVFLLSGIVSIVRHKLYLLECTRGHLARVVLYTFLLTALLLYALVRGNMINAVIHEVILFYSFAIFLILGVNDSACRSIIKLLTIVFWSAFILSLLTFTIVGPSAGVIPEIEDNYGRYRNSIAYGYFRPFIQLGLPLFICGWLERTSRWHYLQILSLVGYLVINVILFKFRGALALSVIVVLVALVMPSSISQKLKLLCLTLIIVIFASSWIYTGDGVIFMKRLNKFDDSNKVVDYRLPETKAYFEKMGYEWLWGRGLGGTFYGRVTFNPKDPINMRTGVHIGWVSVTLKGGVPLLFTMLTFFGAWIRKNKKGLQRAPYYTAAKFWIPIFFVNWLVNPISFHAVNVSVYGLSFLLMAQFGKRSVSTEESSETPKAAVHGG